VTLAALAIPEVMGYSKIAGMPVITGLYTILIPIALFALLGSSRHLVVGADSATAAIMAAGLAGLAATASPQYVALAGLLALITAAILLIARLIGLGFLADFLSRTVLIGFLTGVGIQVAIGQIAGMLGLPGGGSGTLEKLVKDIQQLSQTSGLTLLVSLIVLALIIGCKRFAPNVPGALIAVIGMIAASYFFNLTAQGVSTLGTVPSGLPTFGLPQGVTWNDIPPLIPIAFSCFLVILAQSAATSRAYAAKYNERFSENSDLVGLTLASVGAGLSGTFVVNGSPDENADGRWRWRAQPDFSTHYKRPRPDCFALPHQTAGVYAKRGISRCGVLHRRGTHRHQGHALHPGAAAPRILGCAHYSRDGGLHWFRAGDLPRDGPLAAGTPAARLSTQEYGAGAGGGGWSTRLALAVGLHACGGGLWPADLSVNHSLYYANTEKFSEETLDLVNGADPPVSWLCVDAAAIDDVDWSGAATIRQSFGQLKERGVRLVFAEVEDNVRAELDTYGVTKLAGADAYYSSVAAVLAAFEQKQQPATDTPT
jgi:sulfate permease, SulP family